MDCNFSLRKLDKDCFEDLVKLLKDDWPRSAPVIGKITQSQRSGAQIINVCVYADSWPLPKLVIVENLTYKRNDKIKLAPLLVYNRNMTTDELIKMFNSVPFLRRCYQEGYSEFQDTGHRILNIVKDAAQQYGFQVDILACPFIYSLPADQNNKTKLSASIPNGYTINQLESIHADFINAHWEIGSPQVLERIKLWIQHSFSAGAFCSQTNELVAWGMVCEAGCVSGLHTKEVHRRKGLAKAVVTELVRQAQNEGLNLSTYIKEDNLASQNLFQELGFRKCLEGQVAFFTVVP